MRGAFMFEGRRYYVSGKDKTEVEVNKAMRLKELQEGVIIESNMLTKDWAIVWMETYKAGACNDKTYRDYEHRLDKFILPEIGYIRLKDVKQVHLQKVMRKCSHLSQSRIDKIHQCLCQLFTAAENSDLIAKSPARGLVKPKGSVGSHRSITDYEREIILKVAKTHKHGLWVKLMLFCGLRTGETVRVKICHFDFQKKLLFVDGTKTANAQRYVPVPDEILQEVKALNKAPFDYLFTNHTGRPIQPHNRGRMWKSFKKALHVEMGGELYMGSIVEPCRVANDLVPYCLRHTFCTDLQDAGIAINVAKELMGHSDISLTSRIYTHYTEASLNNAAKLLQQYRGVTSDDFNEGSMEFCNTNCNTLQPK
ncbi:MAG: tyrosine-type recombinase/integrase [Firmicutes bacterium]|nr:tyrosine-type recombinase/integrase [Bacillota bacterium]